MDYNYFLMQLFKKMKANKTFGLAVLFQLIGLCCGAQIAFEYSYSSGRNDQARAVVQAADRGYAVVGSTVSYEGNTDVYLMKTNEFGIFQWAKRFGSLGVEWGEDIVQTTDSGFAILGYGNQNGVYDMLFIKTDKNGDSIFTKLIGEADWDFGYALKETSDRGFILAGETYNNGDSKAYLVKLDSSGNVQWKKSFGTSLTSKFEDIIIAKNGDFVMAGETSSFGNGRQVYVVRTDSAGTLLWEKNFGNPGIDFAKGITQVGSDFVFAGATNRPPYPDLDNWIGKVDSLGNLLQDSKVVDYSPTSPTTQNDDWNETVINYNDSLVFAGKRTYHNGEPGNVYIYRFGSNINAGRQDEFQKFISPNTEIAYDAFHTADNGIIFACTGEFMDSSESSIYLIKIDSSLTFPNPIDENVTKQNDYTSLSERKEEINFSIYPNPVNSVATIRLDKFAGETVTIKVIDAFGKLVFENNTNEKTFQFDVSAYNSGIYFVKVSSRDFVTTKRLVITK